MQRRFVDISEIQSRNLEKDGNIDFRYWHNKSNDEKLRAAGIMISVAFNEPHFLEKKIDRTIYSSRKHAD
jgi:hypothetical protein